MPPSPGVIPGLGKAESPESIFQKLVFMDSGLAALRRPGMTRIDLFRAACAGMADPPTLPPANWVDRHRRERCASVLSGSA